MAALVAATTGPASIGLVLDLGRERVLERLLDVVVAGHEARSPARA